MKSAFVATLGVGYATWHYFLLLLKADTVKVDRMIIRFVTDAVGRRGREEIHRLVTEAAAQLSVPVHRLDHAIWHWQRRQRTG